jgi:LAO/AO transport system kinase
VGQDEVDIVHSAHTTLLVTVPGMGDDIQAIKAGLMEIGDIFVVNKADREGMTKTLREIRSMLHMDDQRFQTTGWMPPVIPTVAIQNEGIEDVYQSILDHRRHMLENRQERLKKLEETRVKNQIVDLLKETLVASAFKRMGGLGTLDAVVEEIVARKKDPYTVSAELVKKLLGGAPG